MKKQGIHFLFSAKFISEVSKKKYWKYFYIPQPIYWGIYTFLISCLLLNPTILNSLINHKGKKKVTKTNILYS